MSKVVSGRVRSSVLSWAGIGMICLACWAPAGSVFAGTGDGSADPARMFYDVTAGLDPAAGRITADAKIEIPRETAAPGDTIHLDTGAAGYRANGEPKLTIVEIRATDGDRIPHRPDTKGRLVVVLPAGDSGRTIDVRFTMTLEDADRERYGYYLYAGLGSGSCWYPLVTGSGGEGTRFYDFDVSLDYPSGWAAMVSGERMSATGIAGGLRETYRARRVEGCALILGEGFVRRTIERGGVTVTAFSAPEIADDFLVAAESTADAAAWYESTYGFFPVPHIGVVQGHPRWGGGYPLPQMFMVHLASLRPDFLRWITAHELGHYYWGLHVLDDGERLGWLTLANGIWADQLYMAEVNGVDPAEQWRARRHGEWMVDYLQAVAENREEELGLDPATERALGFDYNSLIRHGKGATGLYLQAALIGCDAFLEFQRALLADYAFKPLPEDEFVERLVAAGAYDAREFFAAWKKGDARIGLEVESMSDSTVTVARLGAVPYPVEVEIVCPGGRIVNHTVPANESGAIIPVAGPRPLEIRLDPRGIVPMVNSSHPGMRGVHVEALHRAGPTDLFLAAARRQLEYEPDDHRTRYLLAKRLVDLARLAEAVEVGRPSRTPTARYDCLAVIYGNRALARLGDHDMARRNLRRCRDTAAAYGLDGAWEDACTELP